MSDSKTSVSPAGGPCPPLDGISWRAKAGLALLLLLFWIASLDFPNVGDHGLLDDSWQEAYGYFLKHRLQAGKDYILTFGPLGYFYTTAYDPDLYWLKYGWELVTRLAAAPLLVLMLMRQPGWLLRLVLGLCILFFWAPAHRDATDAFYPLLIVGGSVLLLAQDQPRLWHLLGYTLLVAILCQVKFSLWVLGLAEVVLLVVYLLVSGQRRAAFGTASLFVLFVVGTWVLLGQSPLHLPAYVRGSLEVSRGYAEAMGMPGDPRELVSALILIVLVGALLWTFDLGHTSRSRVAFVTLVLAVGFLLQWKHGFTRQLSHSFKFFAYGLLVPFLPALALRPAPARWLVRNVVAGACVGLALVIVYRITVGPAGPAEIGARAWANLRTNAEIAFAPWQWKARLDARRNERRARLLLPAAQRVVTGRSVDIFSHEQAVLFANGLHWKPRPVFQSYSAYTPSLLAANAAFLRSDAAPDYLLIHWLPIDDRVPASEDAPALLEILRRYRPVLHEGPYELLEHRPGADRELPEPRLIHQRVIRLGEEVALDTASRDALTLALHIRYTALGKLRNLVYAPAPLSLMVQTEDGARSTFRLISSLAEGGFLFSPFLARSDDLLRLYRGTAPRVVAFRVDVQEGGESNYEPDILMTLTEHPGLLPAP